MVGLPYFRITYLCEMWYLKLKQANSLLKTALKCMIYVCFFITWSCENGVSQKYVDAKDINISKAAFKITGFSCCRFNQNSVNSFSLN
jgi:hypothetical protein